MKFYLQFFLMIMAFCIIIIIGVTIIIIPALFKLSVLWYLLTIPTGIASVTTTVVYFINKYG